jgi:hypothetical protein
MSASPAGEDIYIGTAHIQKDTIQHKNTFRIDNARQIEQKKQRNTKERPMKVKKRQGASDKKRQ